MELSELRLRTGDWMVVADGRKALLLCNEGDVDAVALKTRKVMEGGANPRTNEQGVDRPGHFNKSSPTMRGSYETTDLHEAAERAFARDVAEAVGAVVPVAEGARLVLVAPARVLGEIRSHLSPAVAKHLVGTLSREFTKMPIPEIEAMLNGR